MLTFSTIDINDDDAVIPNAVTTLHRFTVIENYVRNADHTLDGTVTTSAEITFFIWKSNNKRKKCTGVIARKDYTVSAADYAAYLSSNVIKTTYNGSREKACESYALATLDTKGKSYFDGAVQS